MPDTDLKKICKNELKERIIPFWNTLRDDENGGFYGFVGNDLAVDKKADKGVILCSRILWFYSSAYKTLGDEKLLYNAKHAFGFLKKAFDPINGGVYWMMTFDGKPADTMKHTYNQAFAIYALSAYYLASKDTEALALAEKLFETVEEKCRDGISYGESYSADWEVIPNEELSENGIMAEKTMNTALHLIEAYTVLYEANGNGEVLDKLIFLLDTVKNKIYDKENKKLFVFFDSEYNVRGDIHSYGHDIEASWLIDRACKIAGDVSRAEEWAKTDLDIAGNIYNIAFENGALNNERDGNSIDKKRIWWVQAEGVVGFVNAYQKSGDEKFLSAAADILIWIEDFQTDKRKNSEWWGEAAFDGKPMDTVAMVNPWKCPYHNGRMCIEIMNRKF